MLVGLTPGSGKGDGQGGAGSSSGGAGGAGGASGGQGGGQQKQYQGDMVSVRYQEGDLEAGMIVKKMNNHTDRPPKVESGEMLMMHSLGARLFFDKKGKFHIYDKTSNQDDQNSGSELSGVGSSSSGSSSSSSSSGQGRPLKNAPPLKPQSVHIQFDGKGKMTTTSFRQDSRQQRQDPADPNSQELPDPFG